MKKISIFLLLFIALVTFIFFYFKNEINQPIQQLEKPKQEEFKYMGNKDLEKEANIWLAEKEKEREEFRKNVSPEKRKRIDAKWKKMEEMSSSQIEKINFYGKVIDQHGDPIEGAIIKFYTGNSYLAVGTGGGTVISDSEGMFNTSNISGSSFNIESIIKNGYEYKFIKRPILYSYKRFEDSFLWTDYDNAESPFVITMSKIGKYEQVKSNKYKGQDTYRFIPDGREYTLNMLIDKGRKIEGVHEGDILVSFNRSEEQWSLNLKGINGGLF